MDISDEKKNQEPQGPPKDSFQGEAVNPANNERIIGNNTPKPSFSQRLKNISSIVRNVIVICVIVVIGVFVYFYFGGRSFQVTSASISQTIREIPIQLITNTTTTTIHCTVEELPESRQNWVLTLLGGSEGILVTKVRYGYGLDL